MLRNPLSRGRYTYNVTQLMAEKAAEMYPPTETYFTGPPEEPKPPVPVVEVKAPPPAPAKMNRKQKRRAAVVQKHLNRRLEKDKVPVKIETLPDGGLHVTADMRDEKP